MSFCFIDLETTGLNEDQDVILELAMIITDEEFNRLEHRAFVLDGSRECYSEAPLKPPEELMDDFVRDMHTRNGLLRVVRMSKLKPRHVEPMLLSVLSHHYAQNQALLAGNSVHFDRKFLRKHMPALENYLSHRNLDVSTLRYVMQMVFGITYDSPKTHRAGDDVVSSVAQASYYVSKLREIHGIYDGTFDRLLKDPEIIETSEEF